MTTINVRMPKELVEKIEKQLEVQKKESPGMRTTKSDIVRNILELHFSKKGSE